MLLSSRCYPVPLTADSPLKGDRDGERRQDRVQPHLRMGPARPGEGRTPALDEKADLGGLRRGKLMGNGSRASLGEGLSMPGGPVHKGMRSLGHAYA